MEEIDHSSTREIVCPHCSYEYEDSWEYNGYDTTELKCPECDEQFHLEIDITVEYTTSKISCDDYGNEHEWKLEEYIIFEQKYKGAWVDLPESEWEYTRIMKCSVCDGKNYIKMTKEDYEKEFKNTE